MDSSIIALYNRGRPYNNATDGLIIRTSWDSYRRSQIEQAHPEHIICIGRGVANVLEDEIRELVNNNYTVIAQPNDFLTTEERMSMHRQLYDVCLQI